MKLLQILYPGLGGHSSVAFSLIEADEERAYKHTLLGYGIEEPSEMFVAKASELNVTFDNVKKKRGLDLASQRKVYKSIKKQAPDYMIVHSTSLVAIVFIYALFHKVKWTMVEHQSNNAKSKTDWIYSFLILLLAPKIVYLTPSYKKEIRERFGWLTSGKKIQIIPNGINIKKFHPVETQRADNEIVLSMISRLTPLRDHKTLIEAVSRLAISHPCKLYIAGEGETKQELMDLVKELNVSSIVCFTGILNEDEVIDLLHKTDIYIHSSLAETLSTSLLQVMACKVPIIATDIEGINNLLTDGEEALLFEVQNISSLITKITAFLDNEALRKNCSKQALIKVREHYSCSIQFINYKNFLNA